MEAGRKNREAAVQNSKDSALGAHRDESGQAERGKPDMAAAHRRLREAMTAPERAEADRALVMAAEEASTSENWEKALEALKNGADPDIKTAFGRPVASMCLERAGRGMSFLEALLDRGANMRPELSDAQRDFSKMIFTPLSAAFLMSNLEAARLMARRGAFARPQGGVERGPLAAHEPWAFAASAEPELIIPFARVLVEFDPIGWRVAALREDSQKIRHQSALAELWAKVLCMFGEEALEDIESLAPLPMDSNEHAWAAEQVFASIKEHETSMPRARAAESFLRKRLAKKEADALERAVQEGRQGVSAEPTLAAPAGAAIARRI
jgi:hypothetical protein